MIDPQPIIHDYGLVALNTHTYTYLILVETPEALSCGKPAPGLGKSRSGSRPPVEGDGQKLRPQESFLNGVPHTCVRGPFPKKMGTST